MSDLSQLSLSLLSASDAEAFAKAEHDAAIKARNALSEQLGRAMQAAGQGYVIVQGPTLRLIHEAAGRAHVVVGRDVVVVDGPVPLIDGVDWALDLIERAIGSPCDDLSSPPLSANGPMIDGTPVQNPVTIYACVAFGQSLVSFAPTFPNLKSATAYLVHVPEGSKWVEGDKGPYISPCKGIAYGADAVFREADKDGPKGQFWFLDPEPTP